MSYLSTGASVTSVVDMDTQVRVADYLDDQIQSTTDLENLESLLTNVRNQQDLLRKQVGSMFDYVDPVSNRYTA
jgi:hypothetical protein